ncbi:uncharacterized protein LOC122256485 [Penaeus japonicus]|uniref:uncharacterized protein LOC122256485 n=1 Tax=Penaeus japonicus TaxID=27405 RepID=UPI001C70F7B9|nr:uncharacterized protein LOC122256485 [Penaeus japonicus]
MGRSLGNLTLVILLFMRGSWGQTLIDPPSRECRGMINGDVQTSVTRNEYPAGGFLMVLASIPAGLTGSFEFYLCLNDDGSAGEECLSKIPLQLGDGSGVTFDLSKVTTSNKYEIPLILPDDVTCDTCSVQWQVKVEDCGDNEDCTLVNENSCFDLKIRQAKEEEKRIFGSLLKFLF